MINNQSTNTPLKFIIINVLKDININCFLSRSLAQELDRPTALLKEILNLQCFYDFDRVEDEILVFKM